MCKKEGKPVPADEIVKAYEVSEGEHVYLTDEDFQAAEEDGYRTIEVLDFVPHDEIDPITFQRTYYLGPAEGAEKVYALLLKAMEQAELSAVARYVFHDRQQLGALRVRDGVITLENMYFADEIRPTKGVVPGRRPRVDKRELEMAMTLIERFTTSFDHSRYEDEYRARLLKVIRRKREGDEVHPALEEKREAPSDLLAALRESVDAAKRTNRAKNGRKAAKPKRRTLRTRAKSSRG